MFEFHWLLVFQLVSSSLSYQLQCPYISQRLLRASGFCTSRLQSKYTCLYDTNMLSYIEQCNRNQDFVTPGEKYVISGNLRNVDCSSERYQPFRLWSNISGECLYKKSLCKGEGQVIFNNGSLVEDIACRCDYTKGYKFLQRPKQNCFCNPSQEDCSCYIKYCPDGSVLSPDYECVERNHYVIWKCALIEIENHYRKLLKTTRITDRRQQLDISLIAISAIFLLILAYTVIVLIFFEKIETLGKSKDVWCTMLNSRQRSESETPSVKEVPKAMKSSKSTTTDDETNRTLEQNRKVEDIKEQFEKRSKENQSLISQIEIQNQNITSLESMYWTLPNNTNRTRTVLQEIEYLRDNLKQIEDESMEVTNKLQGIEQWTNALLRQNTYSKRNQNQQFKVVDSDKQKYEEIKNNKELLETLKTEIEELNHKINSQKEKRKQMYNDIQEIKGNIRVFCRVRQDETIGKDGIINHMQFPDQEEKIIMNKYKLKTNIGKNGDSNFKPSVFNFDKVFSHKATQIDVYKDISQLVQSVVDGYNVCIFAYGQTGSGKTYTMEGSYDEDDDNMGIIPRAVLQIFESSRQQDNSGWTYSLHASILEIYNEKIIDLIKKAQTTPRGQPNEGKTKTENDIKIVSPTKNCNEVRIPGLSVEKLTTKDMALRVLREASTERNVKETKRNKRSSRGHCVVILKFNGSKSDETINGTLHLVDLAGSESMKTSGPTDQRQNEAKAINQSLLHFGRVMRAVEKKDENISYRDSKLIQLLQNSLGGNSKTLMFVNVSPKEKYFQETLKSLNFALTVNKCNLGTAKKM